MNKSVQKERIRRVFIDSAKSLIKGEGISALTVRNLAADTGYSYTTLYGYFKNVNILTEIALSEFTAELLKETWEGVGSIQPGKERVYPIVWNFCKYFIQYPGLFQILFLMKKSEIPGKEIRVDRAYFLLDELWKEDWKVIEKEKSKDHSDKQVKMVSDLLKDCVIGFLTVYLTSRNTLNFSDFRKELNSKVDFLLNIYHRNESL